MGYPNPQQPYQQGPPPGYGPQQGPPGYGQQQPQGYPPQQGYGPPAGPGYQQGPPVPPGGYGYQQGGGTAQPNWDQMYEGGDPNAGTGGKVFAEGWWPATVAEASYGLTRNGDKYAWTVKFTLASGPDAGSPITTTMAISEYKKDGSPNPAGIGILFRQLGSMGIPVGDKFGGQPGSQPYWRMGWTGDHVAQALVGHPADIQIKTDPEYGNSKVNAIRAPRQPGQAPGGAQQAPQPAPQQPPMAPAMGGYQGGPVAQGYAQPGPQGVQGGQPVMPQPYQAQAGPPAAQPGTAEFTPGQTWNPAQQAGPPQAAPQQAQQGPPQQPPWNGAGPPQQPAAGQAPGQQPGMGGAPQAPPWQQ